MKKAILRQAWKWFQILFVIYFVMGALLYFFQEKLIFHPKKLAADYQYHFDIPFNQIDLAVSQNKNLSIVQFTVPDSIRKGVVLYFHGNRGNINRYAQYASHFTRNGYEAWMIDYPGYGKTTGTRTEKTLYEDAITFYKIAISRVPAEKIIIYGKSLGTGIASHLASVRDCKMLILETPYYSMPLLARHYFFIYPAMALSKYELPTNQFLQHVKSPVIIFHGTKDGTIPIKHSTWLKEKKPELELVVIGKGKHNNLSRYPIFQQKLDQLLMH